MIVFLNWLTDESLFSLHIHVFRSKKQKKKKKCKVNGYSIW